MFASANSNERAIIARIRKSSASWEEQNLSALLSTLRARVIALVIIFLPSVMLRTCDGQAGEIRKVVVAVFTVHAAKSTLSC